MGDQENCNVVGTGLGMTRYLELRDQLELSWILLIIGGIDRGEKCTSDTGGTGQTPQSKPSASVNRR